MRRSTAKALSIICLIFILIICGISFVADNEIAVLIIFVIYLPFQIYLNYCQRCKNCGRWPRKGDIWHQYCPRCGEPMDD